MERLSINNLVVKFDCQSSFDLLVLHKKLENCDYEPEIYFALIHRRMHPKTSFLINGSGIIIINGLKRIKDIQPAAKYIVSKLRKLNYNAHFDTRKLNIVNIIAGSKFPNKIPLEKLAKNQRAEYNPETFPGLILKLEHGKVLLFSNGTAQLVGFRKVGDMKNALIEVKQIIDKN